ncbi:MAG: MBL fold metallo-hydrolase [Treponema sp.]|jgi:glyoxylase-like metal-dependent hydrolase (beta-lactamase superfamily II)|nr:MBL fold metallo-hydrolase [Treponema sp.]
MNIKRLVVGPVATNCYIYPLPGEAAHPCEAALIDPGDEPGAIIAALEKLSLVPRYILLTHGHFDHICALAAVAAHYKDAAPVIAAGRPDAGFLGPGSLGLHKASVMMASGGVSIIAGLEEPPAAGRLLEEGDVIGPFTVLLLPGHTPGCAAYWDKEAGVLFSGDVLFRGEYGRTELPGGDEAAMRASLRRLLALDGNITVYPGHGGSTTIAREAARFGGLLQ